MKDQIIYISQIPDDGLTLNVRIEPDALTGEDIGVVISEPVLFKGMLRPVSGRYILSGRLNSTIQLICDRCLVEYNQNIEQDIMVHFSVRKRVDEPLEAVVSNAEDDLDDIIDDRIDIAKVLREQIVLQIPMKALCSETCKGLCSRCGANLNEKDCGCDRTSIDPRLIKLKDLLEK